MKIDSVDFSGLPFSRLFQDYVHRFDNLKEYFETDPFDKKAVKSRLMNYTYGGDRRQLVKILGYFNKDFDLAPPALENLEKLSEKDTLTVVTGQQLGIYGGLMYTVYKAATAVSLAYKLSEETGRTVVPVFWLADEDHDYEEVSHVNLPDRDEVIRLELKDEENRKAVAERKINRQIQLLRDNVRNQLVNTDFSRELWENLDTCFQPGISFRVAFGRWMSILFSKYGLILAGSSDPGIKTFVREDLIRAVEEPEQIKKALEGSTIRLEDDYHQQADINASLLFIYSKTRERQRLVYENGAWSTDDGQQWNESDLRTIAEHEPERLSPNVFLRPILQDRLLPNIAYIAGPGEIAYYAQMKQLYRQFDQIMPVIFPRMSGTIIEPPVERIMQPLPFEFYEYAQRIEDLEKAYLEKSGSFDVNAFIERWKNDIGTLSQKYTGDIRSIDPTLEGTAGKALSVYSNELDKLKGKIIRHIKKENEVQIGRIHKIHTNLFPERSLQERTISFIYYINKYGMDVFNKTINEAAQKDLNRHQLIYFQD